MLIRRLFPLVALPLTLAASTTCAQLPAFNGAEGFGGTFAGTPPPAGWFSNATVYHVTNLNDSGPGSLRNAFTQNTSNRIIVFDVGGTIRLTSGPLDIKNLSNYYVAGQTAPSPVTVYGNTTQITHSANRLNSNVILRYMTFRKGVGNGEDAITFSGGDGGADLIATNMIIDHVSASWSQDEVLSVANNNTNVTVQYSMITDPLTSDHAYGSLIRPRIDSNVTFHHNLYANDKSRNPRAGTYYGEELTLDFRNNVIYNWSDRAGYTGGASEDPPATENVNLNYVGNYLIAGPSTPTGSKSTTAFTKDIGGDPVNLKVYQAGNIIDSNHNAVRDGFDTGWAMFAVSGSGPLPISDRAASPFVTPAVTTQTANAAYDQVISHVGNHWWSRDAVDARIIGNVQNNTNPPTGVNATEPDEVELNAVLSAPMTTRPAGWDADNDGMPDDWESMNGHNPNSSLDWKFDSDNDGYVNLQEYLDEIGAFPAPGPIVFTGGTNNRYALITNWHTIDGMTGGTLWQPTRFDEAVINSGTVRVDGSGQHARLLKIGAQAGETATLEITFGRIDVEEALIIGADPAATAVLNLGGGILGAHVLSRGVGGTFNFTGGVLEADVVEFDLENRGGFLSPGPNIGQTHVLGDLSLLEGVLQIELASPASADALVVDGTATLGGALNVLTPSGYTPSPGDSWRILSAGNITGAFNSVPTGFSLQAEDGELWLFFGAAPTFLAGDYNEDGTVNAGDYVVWRKNLGARNRLPNETESLGIVDDADYEAWRANFGASRPAAGQLANAEVPEPAFAGLVILSLVALRNVRMPKNKRA